MASPQMNPEVCVTKRLNNSHSECSLNSDEAHSKRLRVTLVSHAEVVDNGISRSSADCNEDVVNTLHAKRSACVVDNDVQHPAENLRKGLRVSLQGLDARPQLNGQSGQILGFYVAQSRWLVSLDDGSKKLVLSANLQPEATVAVSTDGVATGEMGALAKASVDAGSIASNLTMAVPPKDYLKASLEAMRFHALRRVEGVSGKTSAEVCQLRADVQQLSRRHHQHLLHYCAMKKPTDHKEQSARNHVRKELREVAETVQPKMLRLFDASTEPTVSLQAARAEQLNAIDGMVDTLMALRRETVEIFDEYSAKVKVDCLAAEAGVKSLAPAIEDIDKFMQCCAQEVQCEKMEADRLHQELVDKLEKEEHLFVCANDSPSRSPRFAKVREDLAACKRLIEEQACSEALNTSMMQSWDSILKAMPSKKLPEPEPQRNLFWRRFGCGNRTASCSA